ncbi:hypothetical protein [Kitasatospora sp. NPDC097643]|uniref:hypothetical protein n=1 Tax=Kitasatospora sp. NPDC097643 TaxID=3157230 RepID=UPI00332A40B8
MSAVTAVPAALPRMGALQAAWLRHRAALRTVIGVLAGLAVLLLVSGYFLHRGFERSGAGGCDPATRECNERWKEFLRGYGTELMLGSNLVYFLGGAIGAFVGGPLLAREFEHGTFRFAWTQGAGRTRWTASGLAVTAGVLAVATALLAQVFSWWIAPMRQQGSRFAPLLFVGAPPALAGRVLLVFAVSALAGAVLRRTVVAVGIGVAASVLVTLGAETLRFHYRAPLQETLHTLSQVWVDHRWTGSSWYTDPAGNRIGTAELFDRGHDYWGVQKLVQDGGYAVHEVYQPDDRYWPFQFIELGWMTVLAVALGAVTVWWVRRGAR